MKYYISILSALIVAANVVYADDKPQKRVLMLKECITIAVENNTSIKGAEEDKNKAMADYRVALAQRLLSIDTNIKTEGYTKSPLPLVHQNWYEWASIIYTSAAEQAVARYLLDKYVQPKPSPFVDALTRDYDLGITLGVSANISVYNERKAKNQALAKVNVDVFKIQNKKTINDVIYNVKNAYYSYYLAKQVVVLKEKDLKNNQDRLRMTEILFKNALKSILDINRAKYELSNSQLELQKAINAAKNAKIELFRIMNVEDQGSDFILEENIELNEISYTLEQIHNLAEINSPDLQFLKKQTELYRVRVQLAKASHFPEVDFQVGGGWRNSRIDFTNSGYKRNFSSNSWKPYLGVNLVARINIFASGGIEAQVDSARADYNKALYKENDMKKSIRTLVENQYVTIQDMKKQIELSMIVKENAEKSLLMTKKTYETGAVNQLDLQDAMMAYENAEMNYQRARFDYLMAIAKISSMVGLGEDTLCKK
jgi:outer membrane protein TolC